MFWKRTAFLDISDVGGKTYRVASSENDVFFSFSVNKNSKKEPNPSTVEIYNLNDGSISFIENNAKNIYIYAGYNYDVKLIFSGNLDSIDTNKDGTDIVTRIEAKDGGLNYRHSKISKSYPPRTKLSFIINDLTNSFELTNGQLKDIPDYEFKNGYIASGDSKTILTELTKTHNLQWSIQDNTVNIYGKDSDNGRYLNNTAILINDNTGMINSPKKYKEQEKGRNSERFGINITSLLQPTLLPGDIIKVESRFINGFFVVDELSHSGSASIRGNNSDFFTEIKTKMGILG